MPTARKAEHQSELSLRDLMEQVRVLDQAKRTLKAVEQEYAQAREALRNSDAYAEVQRASKELKDARLKYEVLQVDLEALCRRLIQQ